MGTNLPAVFLGANRTAVSVSADGDRTCALLDSGGVRCWGDGEFGALGNGNTNNTGDGVAAVDDVVDLGGNATATIGAGPCVVSADGDVLVSVDGGPGGNGCICAATVIHVFLNVNR